ncbi:putative fad-dependent isoamyl alcohol [Diaporthe ampelina]|uniref:Putative fad-dependent isoamyl alcohol n=1 Tax=Diaporthe ampelina TaxID=1214573 RepID=A0A0G2HZ95_9PEZI|nr:putative fad-dependent isoamyl alcohol [Diaporthe ampelina]
MRADVKIEYNPAEVMNPVFQNDSRTPFTPASQPWIKFAKDNNIRLVIKNTGHDFAGKSTGAGSLSLWTHNMNEAQQRSFRLDVGLAGGYTPGGGHSLLNSVHGMAADAVLEWEAVTAEGKHLIATPRQDSDLYWALSGGGDVFAFYPTVADTPGGMDFEVANNSLIANSIVIPNKTPEEIEELFSPLLSQLEKRGIHPLHLRARVLRFLLLTTRLISRDSVYDPKQLADIVAALQAPIETRYYGIGCRALNVKNTTHPDNTVLPEWRNAVALCNLVGYWDWTISTADNLVRKEDLVGQILPAIDAATPGAGSYLNEIEAEYRGDWKNELYGVNYDPLLSIKDKYDPAHLFYAHFAVGMDYWTVGSGGRLCRA